MKRLWIFALSTVLLAGGCSQESLDSANDRSVVIDPTIADPELFPKTATRATDTDFEHGDRIGVTIRLDGQTYIGNRALAFDAATQLFAASGVRWYHDASRTSELSAYYPYREGAAAPAEFAVLADQNGDNYKASDFIAGIKQGVRPDKEVDLIFKHKMARLIVHVENETDSDITEILFTGTIGTGLYDAATGDFGVKADAATLDIKACERRKNELYYALLVPQNGVEITAAVTTADGEQREATIEDPKTHSTAVDLVSGCNRELYMEVLPDGLLIKLSGEIDPWVDGEDIDTDNPAESTISWGGEIYKTIKLADGRTWMAENLRYVPEGKSISPTDFSTNTGIWYPCKTEYANGTVTVTPATDTETITAHGLFYSPAVALGADELTQDNNKTFEGVQGICPNGWHIPTLAEWIELVGKCSDKAFTDTSAVYYDQTVDGAKLSVLNEAGFNIIPVAYVNGGTKYGNTVLNKTDGKYLYGYPSMGYYACSTGRISTTNTGTISAQMYAAMLSNMANKQTLTAGQCNFPNGISVRCIKNAE